MSSSHTVRCDQCGRAEDDTTARADGWLRILPRAPIASYYNGRRMSQTDLCSWPCARDYAMVQADQSPEKT